jgi:8-oxo-dGTP pyrophosphatase MutT (NUDIX family)
MTTHFGIYGLLAAEGRVLLVRKTRGPYSGLLDLPGGAPEPGEADWLATLRREIAEETGLALESVGPWRSFKFSLTEDSRGHKIDFVHSGVWTRAGVALFQEPPRTSSADTPGACGSRIRLGASATI